MAMRKPAPKLRRDSFDLPGRISPKEIGRGNFRGVGTAQFDSSCPNGWRSGAWSGLSARDPRERARGLAFPRPSALFLCILVLGATTVTGQTVPNFTINTPFPAGVNPVAMDAGDVVGSSLPDLVAVDGGNATSSQLVILENIGPGTPPIPNFLTVGAFATHVVVADLDGDGDRDIVTGNLAGVSVMRNVSGNWARADYAITSFDDRISIADISGDGNPDIVRGTKALIAAPAGFFGSPITLFAPPANAQHTVIGDFDGNGTNDMCTITVSGTNNQSIVAASLRRRAAAISFLPAVTTTLDTNARATGAFGIADPLLVANPGLYRVYAVPPSIAGLPYVMQIYGFDPTYWPSLTASIFVSNAVTGIF